MTKDNVLNELKKGLEMGRAGQNITDPTKLGYVMSAETIVFKGKKLVKK